ncbi:MAG: diaminopimelate decarboxylase [Candidatus Brocadiia bacterium]
MDFFRYHNNELYCEGVPISKLAERFGTPLYVYSSQTIRSHYQKLRRAFPSALICYSLKSNSNLNICRLLKSLGAGFDVVSGGELFRALKIGANPKRIVFAGVGKTAEEIAYGLKHKILMLNAESVDEVQTINEVAERLKVTAPVALRINPDVEPHTHRYLKTAIEETKFGLSIQDAKELIGVMHLFRNIRLKGLHLHIGSQITETKPYLQALKKVLPLIDYCRRFGHNIEYLDTGGGFGIFYKGMEARPAREFGRTIMPHTKRLKLIIEPGRFIVGNAGIIVTRVIRTKSNASTNFVICDAGMNTLIRPALYEAYHRIEPVTINTNATMKVNVVGPICESGDFLGKERILPRLNNGALLAVFSAGAYGYSMASTYNSRPKPAEVLVTGNKYKLITRAETYNDLIRLEK